MHLFAARATRSFRIKTDARGSSEIRRRSDEGARIQSEAEFRKFAPPRRRPRPASKPARGRAAPKTAAETPRRGSCRR
ncbi:hypothetical protein TNCT_668381 [Trichonephila clavata]|uniref:Uncharacterized protein n=1 Tax=Trichonephila clavata TaxID=2740835 RepID=A0A8X6IAQ5_TRICU|nr:hypothetical protein TNCT_668381 [Trichonephila clavata]